MLISFIKNSWAKNILLKHIFFEFINWIVLGQ